MHYTQFSVEQQEATLKQRIQAWEADHFGHEINKQALATLPDSEEKAQAIKTANDAQATLEGSINAAKAYLDSLHHSEPTPTA